MKTMYRMDVNELDMEGRGRNWKIGTKYDTLENIEAAAAAHYMGRGNNYRIVARTIDEATFSVVDITVKEWDWWTEVGQYEEAKRNIVYRTEEIAKLEAKKARSKSETSKAKIDKEIERHKELLEKSKKVIENRK